MSKAFDKEKRAIEALVISDTHLGTYGCKANPLLQYLKTVRPKTIILNGDIIDVWQFSKSYFPKSHSKVIRQLMKMMEAGSEVYYLPGNHDENFRRFVGLSFGRFKIENKVVLELDGTRSWIFHGDVFDVFMHHSKWLAKFGAQAYGFLTLTNRFVNALFALFGQKRISLSRDIKRAIKGKRKSNITSRFESTVAGLAINKNYDFVICGHIHWPENKLLTNTHGQVTYLNSGDWVENMTALEFYDGTWHLKYFEYVEADDESAMVQTAGDVFTENEKVLFEAMLNDVLSSS